MIDARNRYHHFYSWRQSTRIESTDSSRLSFLGGHPMIKFWRLPPRSAERIAAKAAWEAHYGPISYDALPDYFRFDKRFNPKLVSRHGTGYAVGMTGHHHHYSTQLGQRVATLLARTTLAPLTDWTVTAPMTLQSPSGIDCDLDTVFEIAVERLRSVFVV